MRGVNITAVQHVLVTMWTHLALRIPQTLPTQKQLMDNPIFNSPSDVVKFKPKLTRDALTVNLGYLVVFYYFFVDFLEIAYETVHQSKRFGCPC